MHVELYSKAQIKYILDSLHGNTSDKRIYTLAAGTISGTSTDISMRCRILKKKGMGTSIKNLIFYEMYH